MNSTPTALDGPPIQRRRGVSRERPDSAARAERVLAGDRARQPRTPDRKVDIRRLGPGDMASLEAHLLRLEGHDRRMRFCGDLGDEAVRRHCALIDWPNTQVLGCEVDGVLRGAVELSIHPRPYSSEAELAMSLEREFQGQGLGALLMRKALVLARNRYVSSVFMTCMVGNRRMQKLAAKFGAILSIGEGEMEGRILAPWPTFLTIVEEAALESRAYLRAAFSHWPRPAARPASA
ncbi:GNAT family N-acetyltransferase [Limibaculum sp. M0105]|uniref:GNAT family N-acetyltransferase n=1 Tax=Thermohalobaculum xanthum TaxID=2753746 RepID=A0A8J7MBQ7_9RHOB|nr:GNAT family N-acetyltransferase [Thermohalobaculum xanthum]MBK0401259.1 GNAT family N-acetyltransferase [Thermohalobaculum xanthum]